MIDRGCSFRTYARVRTLALLLLPLVVVACGPHRHLGPQGTSAVTLAIEIAPAVAPQGVPMDPDGSGGVTRAVLEVFRGEKRLYFDDDGFETASPGVDLELTAAQSQVTLHLDRNETYDFLVEASDDGANVLAEGWILGQLITDSTSLVLPLRTLSAGAALVGPVTVLPNEVFDLRLEVWPPNRTDLRVPATDYSAEFDATGTTILGSSARGVRLVAACAAIAVTTEVRDFRNELVAAPSLEIPVNTFCPEVDATIGVDLVPPFVAITSPEDGTQIETGVAIVLQGEANDMQSGIDRIEIYEGVVLHGQADVDDSTVPATWSFSFTPTVARDYVVTAVAIDAAGNESESTITLHAVEPDPGAVELEWTRQFGTAAAKDWTRAVAVGPGGTIIAAGTVGSDFTATEATDSDAFVRKYDPTGALIWVREFGSAIAGSTEEANGVAVDGDGNVYVTGSTTGTLDGISPDGTEAFLRKYDQHGDVLWTRQIRSAKTSSLPRQDRGVALAIDSSGNVYLAGETRGSLHTSDAGTNAFLRKYDPDGNVLWGRQFGTTSAVDRVGGVALDGLGAVLVVGHTQGGDTPSVFVFKHAATGESIWDTSFAGSWATGIAASGEAIYAVGNGYDDTAGPFVVKLEATGSVTWALTSWAGPEDLVYAIAVDGAGNPVVAGTTWGDLGGPNAGVRDAFVRAFDPAGSVLWTIQYGTESGDEALAVVLDASGDVLSGGMTFGDLDGAHPEFRFGDAYVRKDRP